MRILALVVALAAPTAASADDSFEARASAAIPVAQLDDLVWALDAPCDRGGPVEQRQCRLLRDALAARYRGAALLVDAEPGAFVVGGWDAARKSVALRLSSCIRCARPIAAGARPRVLTGPSPRVEGGNITTPWLHDNAQPFTDETAGKAWVEALETARVQMVVKLAAQPAWSQGGIDGLQVDVVAWRVYTPCDGTVVIASPRSGQVPADPKACGARKPTR